MMEILSKLIDKLSSFFAARKGLLPLLGIGMVILNFLLPLLTQHLIATSDLFLHLGIIVAILGIMLAWAL
jgi:hypothetical protein